jgi:hypothetical protein
MTQHKELGRPGAKNIMIWHAIRVLGRIERCLDRPSSILVSGDGQCCAFRRLPDGTLGFEVCRMISGHEHRSARAAEDQRRSPS